MATRMNNTAEDEFVGEHLNAVEMLRKMTELMSDVPADSVNCHWGHVADMKRVNNHLRDALGNLMLMTGVR